MSRGASGDCGATVFDPAQS